MDLPDTPATHFDLQSLPANQSRSTERWKPARSSRRLAIPIIIVGTILCAPINSHVLAQSGSQADSPQVSEIDHDAMEALNKMGAYLRTLKSFQVNATIADDDVTDDGQIVQSNKKVDMVASKPDRFRAEITGDDGHRFFFFDGKQFTLYGASLNYYATVPAPPTIAKLIDDVSDKYGIELPLVDLFQWGTDDEKIQRIKGAMDIGPSTIGGVTCEQYAFRQKNIDWQIWIQLGEFPLPRKVIIRTLTDDARPQFSEILTWNLAPSFSDDAFTFDPPHDAERITIAEVKAHSTEKNK